MPSLSRRRRRVRSRTTTDCPDHAPGCACLSGRTEAESLWEFIDEDRSVQTRLGLKTANISPARCLSTPPINRWRYQRDARGAGNGRRALSKTEPLVCALPMTRQQININTLDARKV